MKLGKLDGLKETLRLLLLVEDIDVRVDIHKPNEGSLLEDVFVGHGRKETTSLATRLSSPAISMVMFRREFFEFGEYYVVGFIKSGIGVPSLESDSPIGAHYLRIRQGAYPSFATLD